MAGAYYNEFEPATAGWLRGLISTGLIADGDVDERSILDVRPDDLRGYTQCHFFAGIGGWSFALRVAGWDDTRPVWTGSPPCQPFSAAGKQLGRDDPRHLAPHFISLVGACRPGVLFGEQVASSDVFGKAPKRAGKGPAIPPEWAWIDDLSDRLEATRYAVGASDIPSAGIGAPHIRQRTFFGAVSLEGVEYSASNGWDKRRPQSGRWRSACGCAGGGLADAKRHRSTARVSAPQGRYEGYSEIAGNSGDRCARSCEGGSGIGRVADADENGCGPLPLDRRHNAEHHLEPRRELGGARAPESFWSDPDWLFCRDELWRPVESGTFPLAHGLPAGMGTLAPEDRRLAELAGLSQRKLKAAKEYRKETLRGYGNAINPWAAAEFIRAFECAMEAAA